MRSVHKDEMKSEDALPHVALPSVFLSMLNTFKGEELKARRDENHISCIFDGKYKHGCLKGLNLQLSFDLNTQFLV